MGRIVAISSGNLLTTRPLNKYAIKLSKKQNPRVLFVGTIFLIIFCKYKSKKV